MTGFFHSAYVFKVHPFSGMYAFYTNNTAFMDIEHFLSIHQLMNICCFYLLAITINAMNICV